MEPTEPKEEAETPPRSSEDLEKNNDNLDLAHTKSLESRVSLPRECLVVALISLAQFTTQCALGQTMALSHIIGAHYNITNPGILSWFIAGYSLTVGTFILFSGRLGDVFGWKRMLVFGYVWFAVWNVISGLAWYSNHVLFIFSRVLGGIGPAICMPNGLAMLGALYQPGKRKNMAFAVFGGCAPAGGVGGFLIAGLFNLVWWPWTFWFTGLALFGIAAASQLVIPDPQDEKPGIRGNSFFAFVTELDVLGATSGITALVLFNFAFNNGPVSGWGSPEVIVTLIVGVLLVPTFFYVEIKVAEYPLIPFDLFTSDNAFVLGCIAFGWSCFGIFYYYSWQILYTLRGVTPILGAAYFTPLVISGMLAAITTGFLLTRLKPASVMTIAMCAFLIGTVLVATLPPHQIYWAQIFLMTCFAPWGMDMSFPAATLVISNAAKREHQGTAASLVNTIVNYSISLGLGFAGTVEVYTHHDGQTQDEKLLSGYRHAIYVGTGLAAAGVALAVLFLLKTSWNDRKTKSLEKEPDS